MNNTKIPTKKEWEKSRDPEEDGDGVYLDSYDEEDKE